TGEVEPGSEPLKLAIRDVIQNCIYGVDLNPLAVDLCKVALWIEGFPGKLPLTFLDHRIKCGNSLVGVLDINCLKEGIPDEAYKAVTGDDKKLATQLKKRNKKEQENKGQLSIDENLEPERTHYAESVRELGHIAEVTPQQVREKQARYQQTRKESGWWRDYSACNLWTAAFFTPLTEQNLQLLPTTEALTQLLRGNLPTKRIVDAANKLAEDKHFFHWPLEFPEVFEQGGFDSVLGNPPWEKIKLQEKEFFASHSAEIANAVNKAAREKLIKELPKKNPVLAQAFEEAKHDAEAQGKFIRESGKFPLTAVGDINTYAVFAEITRKLISPLGRVGVIVPTGIVTDSTTKNFFKELSLTNTLVSLLDLENRVGIFPSVHRSYKFCLLTMNNVGVKQAVFSFFATRIGDLTDERRSFTLEPYEISLFNPETSTMLAFRSSYDKKLTVNIYKRISYFSEWHCEMLQGIFHSSNDNSLFVSEIVDNDEYVELYEPRMFHQFDHRYSLYNFSNKEFNEVTDQEHINTNFKTNPRYKVKQNELMRRLSKDKDNWILAYRRIARSTDERTMIASIVPTHCINENGVILINSYKAQQWLLLLSNLNSLVLDYILRQRDCFSINNSDIRQLPILLPKYYTQEDIEFITPRVLELVYTAWDMQPFAKDMGYDGEPFTWNPNRRALLRAELDAYYAKLYGLTRDELRYILDPADVYGEDFPSETFRVLKNNEIKQFGEYRTQRLVLDAWDKMFK
ncbi:Eco57I restriction-modification methylase domain-containing protein, partial [Tolypothrix sp. PCC 7601]|uniref:Eco57I restriction-modification methylase domain-containing protein n=3 Tax=Tolypothrix TaxID=111782 RepID=UPI0005EAA820